MSITSGLKRKKKSFPDLTGDGKVTKKDILRGRGIEGFQDGGDADSRFMNLRRTAEGSGANLRDFTDFIFDPTDPVDYAVAGLMLFPPAGIAAKLIQMGVKGNKLAKTMKKVEAIKSAERGAGQKTKDLFTTDPVKNMAAANGLLFGPTRSKVSGIAGQMIARNELADLVTTNDRNIARLGNIQLYSQEARDQIKADPSLIKKGGIKDLAEIPSIASDLYGITSTPQGREALAQTIKESVPQGIKDFVGTVDSEIVSKRDGGIVHAKVGKAIDFLGDLSKRALNKLPKNKDGSVKKTSPEYKNAKAKHEAKVAKEADAKKAAQAEKRRVAKAEKDLQFKDDPGATARAAAAERKVERAAKEARDSGPQQPQGQGPAIASKVDDANAKSGAAKKVDDAIDDPIPPGDTTPPKGNIFTNNRIVNNPVKSAAILATANEILRPFGDEYTIFSRPTEDTTVTGSDTGDGDVTITGNDELDQAFNNDTEGNLVDKLPPNDWATIMKTRIVNDRGIPLDDKGNFTEKPKFMDYLKSLPGAYADKVSRDEDFAKKMIAGFLNMMRPVEGFVPVNSAVQFGDAYLAEETRQADMLPADAKMLEYLKGDDEAFERYLRAEQAKSGVLLADTKPELARGYYDMLISSLGLTQMPGVNVLDKLNQGQIRLVYNGAPVGPIQVLALMDQNVDVLRDPGFALEEI